MPDPKSWSTSARRATIGAFLLTLLTWMFFYMAIPDAPLNSHATVIVFGSWFLAVLGIDKALSYFRSEAPPAGGQSTPKKSVAAQNRKNR